MNQTDHSQFSVLDYIFFVIVFVVSSGIGLYYAIKSRKKTTTTEEYLLGGRKMGVFPVTCSLAATCLTGASSIGLSMETYAYGIHSLMVVYTIIVSAVTMTWIFLPVFAELKLMSVFKYFELRFNRRVRLLTSAMYLVTGIIYLPFTVYVPALTFQRVTGLDTYVTVTILSLICAVYTAIGGFKAVIWTDVVQIAIMIVSFITILVVGISSADGIENVINAGKRGGRFLLFNIDEPNMRNSLWGHLFSNVWIAIYHTGVNQTNIQRYMSMPDLRKMRTALWIFAAAFGLYISFITILGVVIYANYETCDPFTAGLIKRIDQILPHFIQEKASLFLGFNGIFIAGIFSAGLSTTSSYLNAMSGIIYEDFITQIYPRIKGNAAGRIMKTTVIILGILQIGLVFFIEKMGTVVKISQQCLALSGCALVTLFILGMLVPKANSTGAQAGAIASAVSIFTLIIGGLKQLEPTLPFRTDGCENENYTNSTELFNLTTKNPRIVTPDASKDVFWLFRINFMYYSLIGTIIGLSVGYVVSLLTGGNTVEDQKLLATFLRKKVLQEEEMELRRTVRES